MEEEKKKIALAFLLGMLVMAVFIFSSYFCLRYFSDKKIAASNGLKAKTATSLNASSQAQELNSSDSAGLATDETVQTIEPTTAVSTLNEGDYVIKKGDIQWMEPKDIGNLGLTNTESSASGSVKYLKVGNVVGGKYANAEIMVVTSMISEGPQVVPDFVRILVEGKNKKVIFLTKHINNYDEYYKKFIEEKFAYGDAEKFFGDKISVKEFEYPTEIKDAKGNVFSLDKYSFAFFDQSRLKSAFKHSQLGEIWLTDSAKAEDENITNSALNNNSNIDIFKRGGFYAKLSDGTVVTYSLKLDFFKGADDSRFEQLQATLNGGMANTVEYEKNPSGCGSGAYVYDKTSEINLTNDLIGIGKTARGDTIYGFKNVNNPILKDYYENNYWVEDGQEKKNPEDFLKMNPIVFWADFFGRILAFYRGDIIPPAECGKPVIYLYPEKPMNVSVQVFPGNGFSYTDPEYKNGWNVFADTKSNLRNIADGKTYPYLFWEGAGKTPYETPKQGFVVAKDDLNNFFDEKLFQLGLIEKERNDFKEFWIAKMLENEKPYYFVTFLSKRYMDNLAPLSIVPKPDTVIRVLMDYRGLDEYMEVPGFAIKTPQRKGFTAVEWGGFLK